MKAKKTIKNPRWWLVLIPVLIVVAVLFVPRAIIRVLQFAVFCVEFANIGERDSQWSKKLVDWVDDGVK